MRFSALLLAIPALACTACGATPTTFTGSGDATVPDDAGDTSDGGASDDATVASDAPADDVNVPPIDAAAAWDGSFKGPLTCTTPGQFKTNWSNTCGTARWSIKTGSDSAASSISLLPQLSTIAQLTSLPTVTNPPSSTRIAPTEKTVYALKDVTLAFARLEDDSDYHLVLYDGRTTMITEIPYPGGCTDGSAWQCEISRARAAVDAKLNLVLDQGHNENIKVSVIGVGFYDNEHGQFGVAPNNLELHPLLGICFGAGCDPTQ